MAENNVIGANGDMPWRISDDLKNFKSITLGKPVIMGRKTYDSIGRPLPERDNIIITRNSSSVSGPVFVVESLRAALLLAEYCARQKNVGEVCVIGGGEIYRQAMPLADRIYLTRIAAKIHGDTEFPAIDAEFWVETVTGKCEKSSKNSHACAFSVLDRR